MTDRIITRGAVPLARSLCAALLAVASARAPAASDVVVVRVGDGSAALSPSAQAVFLEHRAPDGSLAATIALPQTTAGSNLRFTLSGTATSEGALVRSADGRFVTLAGYAAAPATAAVSTSTSSAVHRVIARVDGAGTIDTSTQLSAAFSGGSVRSAVTADGSGFWVGGASSTGVNGGAWYVPLGSTGTATQLTITGSAPDSLRWLAIAAGQLYGDSGAASYNGVFAIGTGLPTTAGQTIAIPPGLTTASPYGFAFFDLNPAIAGFDTAYVADDRAIASGGGIEKFTFDGGSWFLAAVFTNGLTSGVRGLAAEADGANIVVYATTSGSTQNSLVRLVDDGSPSPAAVVIATAPANTVYRGVALAWTDTIFANGFQ